MNGKNNYLNYCKIIVALAIVWKAHEEKIYRVGLKLQVELRLTRG